jgi:hypothetical protein
VKALSKGLKWCRVIRNHKDVGFREVMSTPRIYVLLDELAKAR